MDGLTGLLEKHERTINGYKQKEVEFSRLDNDCATKVAAAELERDQALAREGRSDPESPESPQTNSRAPICRNRVDTSLQSL